MMNAAPRRRIAHLDMDAFFASVELLRYPQLRGLPVVIGGSRQPRDAQRLAQYGERLDLAPLNSFARLRDYQGRGVITTATYAARAFGIGSAVGIMKAAALCPDAYLLPVTFEAYRHRSRQFKQAVRQIAPIMEDRGVDEIYLDLSHTHHAGLGAQDDGGRALALVLQQAVQQATDGLTCSIAVAPNKLLAKIGSDMHKPAGITIIENADIATLIWPLPVRRISGIGPRSAAKLQALGIHSIGELAQCDSCLLQQHFGRSYGLWLSRAAQGLDDNPVVTHSEPVSISRETTFARDLQATRDRAQLGQILTRLCEQVAADLQRKGYLGYTVGIKIRYSDFHNVTRDSTLPEPIADAPSIRRAAGRCLLRVDLQRPMRLLGVRIGKLLPQHKYRPQPMGDLFM